MGNTLERENDNIMGSVSMCKNRLVRRGEEAMSKLYQTRKKWLDKQVQNFVYELTEIVNLPKEDVVEALENCVRILKDEL